MGNINRQTDETGGLQIGPTDKGMVRIFVATDSFDIPMDFSPEEARDIAEELVSAAGLAEAAPKKKRKK